MYKVYFTNFGYFAERTFGTLTEALAYAKATCFECSIHTAKQIVASWSPLYGTQLLSIATGE